MHFFSLLPLYKEEMELKVNRGAEALYPKLEKAGINEILNPARKNVCKKRFGFFKSAIYSRFHSSIGIMMTDFINIKKKVS